MRRRERAQADSTAWRSGDVQEDHEAAVPRDQAGIRVRWRRTYAQEEDDRELLSS